MSAVAKSAAREARKRAGRIRAGMVTYLHTLADIRAAWEAQDWLALGYASWDDYLAGEFSEERLRVPSVHRDKAIAELRMAGMSQRAIANSLKLPQSTVGDVSRRLTGSGQIEQPVRVVGRDGSDRPATRATEPPVTGEADAQLDAPGMDTRAREVPAGVEAAPAGAGETAAEGHQPPHSVDGAESDSGDVSHFGGIPADGESVPAPGTAVEGAAVPGVTPASGDEFAHALWLLADLVHSLPEPARDRVGNALADLAREVRAALDEMEAGR